MEIAACEGVIFRGNDMPAAGHARRHSAVSCEQMDEPIEMPFGLWTRMGQRKDVLHGGAHLRHLTNSIEPSVCG